MADDDKPQDDEPTVPLGRPWDIGAGRFFIQDDPRKETPNVHEGETFVLWTDHGVAFMYRYRDGHFHRVDIRGQEIT